MRRVFLIVSILTAAIAFAAEKKPLPGRSSNEKLDAEATVIVDRAEIKSLLGDDMGGSIVVVKVKITPKEGAIKIWLDDFSLMNSKAGLKVQPFQPSQIAGTAKLMVRTTYSDGGGAGTVSNGPTWGGLGGRGSQMPGSGGGVGNTSAVASAEATVSDGSKEKANPLLDTLKKHVLQEKETTETVEGLLYFPVEGKNKVKDLELYYKNPQQGRFLITFAVK